MAQNPLVIPAYAKINLSLEVIGRREDGFHEVATILQTVDLSDEVVINPANDLTVECADPDLSGEQNIVWDAALALAQDAGITPRAHITVHKQIPVAAGLGGGSADAAAALRGLNALWGLGLNMAELRSVASRVGSDVPFLLSGGAALGTGRGNELEMLATNAGCQLLLVVPAESVPRKTPTLYGALTAGDFSDGADTRRLSASGALVNRDLTTENCRNAFSRAAREIFPGLKDIWDRVASVTRYPPCLSGAGPAIFCMPSDEHELNRVTATLLDSSATACLVRTVNPVWAV